MLSKKPTARPVTNCTPAINHNKYKYVAHININLSKISLLLDTEVLFVAILKAIETIFPTYQSESGARHPRKYFS